MKTIMNVDRIMITLIAIVLIIVNRNSDNTTAMVIIMTAYAAFMIITWFFDRLYDNLRDIIEKQSFITAHIIYKRLVDDDISFHDFIKMVKDDVDNDKSLTKHAD